MGAKQDVSGGGLGAGRAIDVAGAVVGVDDGGRDGIPDGVDTAFPFESPFEDCLGATLADVWSADSFPLSLSSSSLFLEESTVEGSMARVWWLS